MSFVVLAASKAFYLVLTFLLGHFFFPMTLKASGLEFAYDPVINNTEFFVVSPYNLFALLSKAHPYLSGAVKASRADVGSVFCKGTDNHHFRLCLSPCLQFA